MMDGFVNAVSDSDPAIVFHHYLYETIPGHVAIAAADALAENFGKALTWVTSIVVADWIRYEINLVVDPGKAHIVAMTFCLALSTTYILLYTAFKQFVVNRLGENKKNLFRTPTKKEP